MDLDAVVKAISKALERMSVDFRRAGSHRRSLASQRI